MTNALGIFLRNIGINITNYILGNIKLTKIYNYGIKKKNIISTDSTTIINKNFMLTK